MMISDKVKLILIILLILSLVAILMDPAAAEEPVEMLVNNETATWP